MEKLELVLEGGAYGAEALGLLNRRVIVVDPEILNEHEPAFMITFFGGIVGLLLAWEEEIVGFVEGFDGIEVVRS